MKRYLISMTVVLAVLLMAWAVFAQEAGKGTPAGEGAKVRRPADVNRPATPESRPMRPRGIGREEQLKVVAAIEEQVAKLKALVEAQPGPDEFAKMRELPEEERTKSREKFAKAREERQSVIEAIEQNIAKLRGGRPRAEEQPVLIGDLQAIRDLAKQEKAEGTAKLVEQLIDRQQRRPEGAGVVAPTLRAPAPPPAPAPKPEPGKKPQ
jgi:hypothetical protein